MPGKHSTFCVLETHLLSLIKVFANLQVPYMFLFVIFHSLHFVSKHDVVAVSVFNVLLTLQTVDGIVLVCWLHGGSRRFDLNWWHPFDVLQSQLVSSFAF